MQIIHFTQSENQKWNKLDLNNLKPVSEVQKQVVLDVKEKLDFNLKDFFDEWKRIKDDNSVFVKYNILSKYFDINSVINKNKWHSKFSFLEINLRNVFNSHDEIDEKILNFLFEKEIFSNLDDFYNLFYKWLFTNLLGNRFIYNYKYLENDLWRKLRINDFESSNIIHFLKEWSSKDIDILFTELVKNNLNLSKKDFLENIFLDDWIIKCLEFEVSTTKIINFCCHRWLVQKLDFLHNEKWVSFDILNILDNYEIDGQSMFIVENFTKEILNFKNNTSVLVTKYPNLNISNIDIYKPGIFRLIDNIWENIFLFEQFDISYDYFKNMKLWTDEENTKFIEFLIKSDIDTLYFLTKKIKNIKIKDLFSMYKISNDLLSWKYFFNISNFFLSHKEFRLYFYEYAIKNNNYYFLKWNLEVFNKLVSESIYNDNINEWFKNINLEKIKEVLDKTWWFITKNLFKNYVLEQEADLDEIWEKYQNAMKKVLSSEEIKQEELDDFLYEAIFMAYRPTWFFENNIKEMIENWEIEDLTHQLNAIKFDSEGYDLVVYDNEKKLEWELDEKIIYNSNSIASGKKVKEFLNDNFINDINVKTFFSKSTEFNKIEKIITKFYSINNDYRLDFFKENLLEEDSYKWKKAYILLNNLYEAFWVVTKDSFPEYIAEELKKEDIETIDNIFSKIKKLKDPKFKKEFEEVCNENVSDEKNISWEEKQKIITILTEKRIIEFGQFMQKKIKKELKKFKVTRWEEKHFKAIISKNIWSFFAKAWAELCTASDKYMWEEERHVHLNLIDQEKNQIIWNIMLYFEEDRDYLIVRWFNPIREIVDNYDNKQLVSEMIWVVKKIAKQNWFDKVYIPKVNFWWHNLSNRSKIQKLVWSESEKNNEKQDYIIKNAWFYQTSIWAWDKIDELYLL